ncbi:serine/threonine protein kinase [Chitinophaga flava]|uniref:non-specific serine/threonine protein kinase n=1 Tax=Chitinophaga flava TaxID=2259036 RepID=A0A365XZM2_9BACT|nr:protein kinase [Chitinophaga flava]RBL91114.1 hypothetical protein DF182_00390 [Chitinophaga flava]
MINELKETHNQNVDQQNGFHHLLDEMSIPYQESGHYLEVGTLPTTNGWALVLSVDIQQVAALIKKVCSVLYEAGTPFRVIKDQKIAARKNDFWFGVSEVGKIIIIYTVEEKKTKELIPQLNIITKGFYGPMVNDAIRLGEVIYVTFTTYTEQQDTAGNMIKVENIVVPDYKKIPFRIDRKYQYWKKKKLLKRRYVPLIMLSRSPKGDLLKSVDLKGLKFNWCFIKEGKCHVFVDNHGRYIKDRLQWQAKVLQELSGHVPVPKFIDYFEQGEESYLVMEFLEGVDLYTKIEGIYLNRKWDELSDESHHQLIRYYLDALGIIEKIHTLGYVHRDATPSNFMILNSGEMYTIDLELSYNLHRNEPTPPFTLGVFGYASPEQIKVQIPTVKEDVYTMGALLLHVITGRHPNLVISPDSEVAVAEIEKYLQVGALLELILRCFDTDPDKRPELEEIRHTIEEIFH